MKKHSILVLIVITFCLLMVACNKENNDTHTFEEDGTFHGVVSGWEVNFDDLSSDYVGFVLEQETALKIGDAVLEAAFGKEALEGCSFIVSEIERKGYFVVSRTPNDDPGYCYSVAIQKEDGRILKIWTPE